MSEDEKDYGEETNADINTESEHEENSICLIQHDHYTNNVGNTYNNFVIGYYFLIAFFRFLLLLK